MKDCDSPTRPGDEDSGPCERRLPQGVGVSGSGGGPGGWGPGGWGPGGFGGPGGHGGRGQRDPHLPQPREDAARLSEAGVKPDPGHGDVRAAIVLLLDEWPLCAHQIERAISQRSGGAWAPGQGSIRRALGALEAAGIVAIEPVDGCDTAGLTPSGAEFVDRNRAALGEPWDLRYVEVSRD